MLTVGCAIALIVVYVVFVRTHTGQRIDEAALHGRLGSVRARDAANELLTTISVGSLALVLVVLAGQALLRRRLALAVVAVVVVLGAVTLTEVLKHVLLARPELVPTTIAHNSFPSGHTTTAFAVGIAATLAAPPRWRRAVAAGALLYGAAIGIATIAAGWHRPSDVAGAMLVVTGWAAAVVLAVALVDRDAFGDGRSRGGRCIFVDVGSPPGPGGLRPARRARARGRLDTGGRDRRRQPCRGDRADDAERGVRGGLRVRRRARGAAARGAAGGAAGVAPGAARLTRRASGSRPSSLIPRVIG